MEETMELMMQNEETCDENGVIQPIATEETKIEQGMVEAEMQECVPLESDASVIEPQAPETAATPAAEETLGAISLLRSEYEALAASVAEELPFTHLADMPRLGAFLTLREKGFSPKEAYLAIQGAGSQGSRGVAHLRAAAPRVTVPAVPTLLSHETLAEWRRLFPHLSDREIGELYRRTAPEK